MKLPRVLYVEDDENDVFFIRHAMKSARVRYELVVAVDGREAQDYLAGKDGYADRTLHPLPCLVLLDLNVPIVPGLELLRWMREQPELVSIPVVIFSASGQGCDREHARSMGATDYLLKPGDMTKLPSLLEQLETLLPQG
ncbi:MAG: response regulator [Planctomycetes bacterium]|nr:response regulator [Planctomycetota bacterium]